MRTTYLITGANRGLGRALVESYLSRPDNIVVAAVRNPAHPTSKTLRELQKASSSTLIIVKIDNSSEKDTADAIAQLRTTHDVTSIDVVIANAGIATVFPLVEEAQTSDLLGHFRVNAIGAVVLFQAVLPLLKQSQKAAKFIAMSTSAGTIGGQDDIPVANAAYGPSKAALNWLVKKIHLENEDLIAFPIHPGFVQTEMGNSSAVLFGLEKAHITVEESVSGLVKVIDNSTRKSTAGKFMVYDGTELPW